MLLILKILKKFCTKWKINQPRQKFYVFPMRIFEEYLDMFSPYNVKSEIFDSRKMPDSPFMQAYKKSLLHPI